jgi:hypothetical protein
MERYFIATHRLDFNHSSLEDLPRQAGSRLSCQPLSSRARMLTVFPQQTKLEVNDEHPRGGFLWHKIILRNTCYRLT